MSDTISARWSSRKLAVAVGCWLVIVALRWHDRITEAAFLEMSWLLLGGFFAGNLIQRYIDSKAAIASKEATHGKN